MRTDYANRLPRSRRQSRRRPAARRVRADHAVGFSWGSFASGLVVGIAMTLAGALLPHWWPGGETALAVAPRSEPPPAGATPARDDRDSAAQAPQFTFWDELPRDRPPPQRSLPTRPGTTQAAAATDGTPTGTGRASTVEYLLQAGSFARNEDAERLRGSLLLHGLQASTVTVTLPGGTVRHRVLVGPFTDEHSMRRAQTQLREQDIEPLPLRRTPS
jgi:hypothetical protein